jgi:hypothetical protein
VTLHAVLCPVGSSVAGKGGGGRRGTEAEGSEDSQFHKITFQVYGGKIHEAGELAQ